MFLYRLIGRRFFAAAANAQSSAGLAATSTAAPRVARNPLEEFFELDRNPEDETPVVYGNRSSSVIYFLKSIFCHWGFSWHILLLGSIEKLGYNFSLLQNKSFDFQTECSE